MGNYLYNNNLTNDNANNYEDNYEELDVCILGSGIIKATQFKGATLLHYDLQPSNSKFYDYFGNNLVAIIQHDDIINENVLIYNSSYNLIPSILTKLVDLDKNNYEKYVKFDRKIEYNENNPFHNELFQQRYINVN